jgi:PAS domain S-box-containing protein
MWLLVWALVEVSLLAGDPKRVLILDSFNRDVAPFKAVGSAFRATLAKEFGELVHIDDFAIDLAQPPSSDLEPLFVGFLEKRLAIHPADLVVAIGGPATQFAAKHREHLLQGIPLLSVGADPRVMPPGVLRTNATLVTDRIDLRRMLEEMVRLQPATTNVAVILGASPLESFWVQECRREWAPYTNRIRFDWLHELPLPQMQERLRALPPGSFVFFGLLVVDAGGVSYDHYDVLQALHQVASAPMYSCFSSHFGRGIVGGQLYQEVRVGAEGARTAIRVLRGEKAGDIPPLVLDSAAPLFDWRELARWQIDPSRLPPDSKVAFRELSFWEQHRWHMAGVIGFCCLQAALIVALVVSRTRQQEGARAAALIADLSAKFIHLAPTDVDREIEEAQRRVCEALSLDRSLLWQWVGNGQDVFTTTHSYQRAGGPPFPRPINPRASFPWSMGRLELGRVISFASLKSLPAEAVTDRTTWSCLGVKSDLTFPLSAGGGKVFGTLGFSMTSKERGWPELIVRRLQLVAQIFTNALVRKRVDQALKESEERLSLAAEAAGAGLWSLDLATDRFWLTSKTRELFEYTSGEESSLDQLLVRVHPDDRALLQDNIQKVLKSSGEVQVEHRILRPDGTARWLLSRGRVSCDAGGKSQYLRGVSVDVTLHKQAEEALHGLSARLISAQEQERARLARELHDDITQRLARLAIDVGRWEAGVIMPSPTEAARAVREELTRLSEDVHALSYRLHPSILEDLGLVAALKAEADRLAQQSPAPIEVKLQPIQARPSHETALGLFRIAQEALRNAACHSGAKVISLSLRNLDDGLQLAVQDDGCGFEPAIQRKRPSLGLASMRERALLLEAELSIESAPGEGTTILVWVPTRRAAK